MRNEFRDLRVKQLDRSLEGMGRTLHLARPKKGWIRAIREASGISTGELARTLGSSRQLPLQLEKAEEQDRITLKSLRKVASALDCELVYALIPRDGTVQGMLEERARRQARVRVLQVEHSMALEDQAAGGIDEAVAAEARRLTGKRNRP